ncbi:farnesyltransferase beta subunit, putative [Plasmodium gallinaceum]|uniref:Protein farnesyltransferase subunit beta n=1 Tax=Plasmodium gallinaceum TaxID=5849 RepID=A0A1J1GW26_PLAGA|nr:farnesyltransferase beta subunit, putative [Plasmodium gallinaceum]CRG96524.1 farnesyltransferase beta subunit, putative [Plasmodium gallinaceum]
MDNNETYILRYNKNKILIKLLYELIKYEKKKDGFKVDFENDKYYKYIESIVKLLFNYIFNLNDEKSYYSTDYNFNKNDCSSSSDNLSENFNSSDDGLSEFFNFNKIDVNKENENSHNVVKDIHKLECIDKNKDNIKISYNGEKENLNVNNLNHVSMKNVNTNIGDDELFENEKCKGKRNEEKNLYRKNNLSDFFFNFHLNCNRKAETIREKKKIEKQILSIYYTSFSSNIIDILLNNSEIEISDIILFFIFENVGNIHDISSFFSKGFYTFKEIYLYIEEYKPNKIISEKNYNGRDHFLYTKNYNINKNENMDNNYYANNLYLIKKEENRKVKEEIHSNNKKELINEKSYPSDEKFKNENAFLNTYNENIYKESYVNNICQENKDIIYLNEILKKESIDEDDIYYNEKNFASQFENFMIKDNMLFVQNFKFNLNKSSVLLGKFMSLLNLQLEKQKHFKFCLDIFFLKNLKLNSLEASKPWIFYWCIHTIYILYNDFEIEQKLSKETFSYIKKCVFLYLNKMKNDKDCFGGGLNQYTHIATTYATVCVFIYLHDDENNFLSFLDKKKIHSYILKLKCADGSFRLHKNGEIDMRGTYCAISICSMCHILTKKVKKNVERYILSCQNYEGGFTSEKYQECHGGYTYCALATLCILGKIKKINLSNLMFWLANKQSNLEGSFMGRTNKLVDSCYSFWVGSIFFLINEIYILKQILYLNELKKKCGHNNCKMFSYNSSNELNNLENNDLKKKNINFLKEENSITNLTKSDHLNGNYNNISNINQSFNKNECELCVKEGNIIIDSTNNKLNENIYICSQNNLLSSQIHKDEFPIEYYKNINKVEEKILFNMNHAKLYLLLCSQSNKGGMKDKPKEKVDYYHTCYALSGLSLIENYISSHIHDMQDIYDKDNISKLNKIHILYNITVQKVYKSYNYFSPNIPLSENKINHKIGKGAYLYLKRLVL